MADNRKLAQGLMMMTPAMREDLAGREQDIQRGKTVELLRRAGKEMYENPAVNTAIGLSPVLGDIQAGVEAYRSAQDGDWGNAGLNAAGMLPFIPMLGKTVWHGSPHTFDKFDMSKIGTGEGAQAYGHGLYLAEAPETAKSYQNALKLNNDTGITTNGEYLARQALEMSGGDKKKAVDLLKSGAIENTKMPEFAAIDSIETMHSKMASPEGALYKVDLPDEQIAKMLDWDKPLSEQPEVYSAIQKYAQETQGNPETAMRMLEGKTAGEAYQMWNQPEYVSQFLNEQGVPGIQYLDQASRNPSQRYIARSPQGGESTFNSAEEAQQFIQNMGKRGHEFEYVDPNLTRNYVVFSDEIPQILERNGTPLGNAVRNYQQFPEGMLGKTDIFETGNPATFEYIRNTEKSPYMGEKFGQDIEPAGRYLSYKDPVVNMESLPSTWESGQVSFNNPLVVNFGENYGTPTNWKNMISESFGGKTGKNLSKAIAESGYDGIVTVDKYGTSEIVDLSKFLSKEK